MSSFLADLVARGTRRLADAAVLAGLPIGPDPDPDGVEPLEAEAPASLDEHTTELPGPR
jgi:hypothetical protein